MALIFSGNGTLTVNGVLPIAQGGTGQTTAQAAINALLPDQAGSANFVLSTDGSNLLWVQQSTGSGLPNQTGQGGKYLTTDGFTAYWEVVSGGGGGGVAGTSGQLQYNDNGVLAGTDRISYNDSDVLTVGVGTTETFTIQGKQAADFLRGGTSVVIQGGSFFSAPEGTPVPAAGNVYLVGGGGSGANTGQPGFISFLVGKTPSETFRIVAGGGWTFDGTSSANSQGQYGDFLMSSGANNAPTWSALPQASNTTYGIVRINPTEPSGLVLSEITGSNGQIGLSATLTDVDDITINKDSSGVISANASGILPSQSGNNGKYLQTNGTSLTWDDPIPSQVGQAGKYLTTDGLTTSWDIYTIPNATSSSTGVVQVDGTTITVDGDGIISGQINAMLPSQTNNANQFLKTDGLGNLSWGNSPIPVAGTTLGSLGGVIIDDNTIKINAFGVINVDPDAIFPDQAGNDGKYLSTNGFSTQWVNSSYILPTASTSVLGGVKIDNSTIVMNGANVISASVDAILPSQGGNANKFLTTNGSTLSWSFTSYILPEATTTTLGGIYTDGQTTFTTSGVLTVTNLKFGASGTGQLVYDATGLSALASQMIYDGTRTLTVGSGTDPTPFTLTGVRGINIKGGNAFDTGSSGSWAGGAINISGGQAGYDAGPGGSISISAGDGLPPIWAATLIESPQGAGSITISAGAGGGGGYPYTSYGGDITFRTADTGPVQNQFTISRQGGWGINGSPASGYGVAGTTLISAGTSRDITNTVDIPNGPPVWGVLGIVGGGTGANTRPLALNNLLPTQTSQTGKILATDGTNAYWWQGIPDQSGNANSFLTTNGTSTSWASFPYDIVFPDQSGKAGYILGTNGTIVEWVAPEIPSPVGAPNRVLITNGNNSLWTTLSNNMLIVPVATTSTIGGIIVGNYLSIDGTGALSVTMPNASANTAGIIKVGDGLSIDGSGTLSVGVGGVLPVANGGTGATTGGEALANLAEGATEGYVLRGNGTEIVLGQLNIATDVTGVLSANNGGTGGSINNLLPSQSNNANKYLRADGFGGLSWQNSVPSPVGNTGSFQYNNNGLLGGANRVLFTSDTTITVGVASTNIPTDGVFNILGASSIDANTYTPSGILMRPGTQVVANRSGATLTLSGGQATNSGGTGGDVVIDAGLSISALGGAGGSVVIRTSDGPGTPLTNRLEIGDGGAWSINGEYGLQDQVLTSTGPDTPPEWRLLNAAAFALTGSTLAPNITTSNLTTVGTLSELFVNGDVGIGTTTPQAPLAVSLGDSSVGIELQPDTTLSTISAIRRSDDWYRAIAIDGLTVRFRTGQNNTVTERFAIDSTGGWNIANTAGSNGQVLTSGGSGTTPTWRDPQGVTSVAVSGGTTGLTTSGGPITTSGTITLGGTLNVVNGGTGANTGIAASQNVSNFGQLRTFSSVTDFNAVQQWGATYVADNVNGPGFPTTLGQYYQMMLSVGSDYSWGSGNVYAAQLAFPRNQNTPYLGVRFKEGGNDTANWGSWQKFSAGYSDTAGTANTATYATTAGNVSGVVAIANGGTGQTTATAALNALLPTQATNANKALVTDGTNTSWRSVAPSYQYVSATANQLVINTTVNTAQNSGGVAYIQVFRNGVLQLEGASKSYTVTGANQITFNSPLNLNDDIAIFSYI
jgi:hypothetical protein